MGGVILIKLLQLARGSSTLNDLVSDVPGLEEATEIVQRALNQMFSFCELRFSFVGSNEDFQLFLEPTQ